MHHHLIHFFPNLFSATQRTRSIKMAERRMNVTKATSLLQASFRPLLSILTLALPFLINTTRKLYRNWKRLPADTAEIIVGFVFCFFGGLYPALFAAVQAVKLGGWNTFKGALSTLSKEVIVILEASEKDDEANRTRGTGKEDEKSYMIRKLNVVMTKVNPEKVSFALADSALNSIRELNRHRCALCCLQ